MRRNRGMRPVLTLIGLGVFNVGCSTFGPRSPTDKHTDAKSVEQRARAPQLSTPTAASLPQAERNAKARLRSSRAAPRSRFCATQSVDFLRVELIDWQG